MLYKPSGSRFWWIKFKLNGSVVRKSTESENKTEARKIEQNYKVDARRAAPPIPVAADPVLDKILDEVIEERHRIPTLAEFIDERFIPFVKSSSADKPQTVRFYIVQSKALKESLGTLVLDKIDQRAVQGHIARRRAQGRKTSTINRDLATLRRSLKLAEEWRVLKERPVPIRLLSGERRRERVISPGEEKKYLAAAPPLLKDVATLLFDLGLRPEECFRLSRDNYRGDGFVEVHHGKGSGSRRRIPCSDRAKAVIARRLKASKLVFPAPTKTGHANADSVKKQHITAMKESRVDPFVLYDIRHTAITRWSKKVDAFTLHKLAGHRSMTTTERYVHPEDERLLAILDAPKKTPAKSKSGQKQTAANSKSGQDRPKSGHRRGHSSSPSALKRTA